MIEQRKNDITPLARSTTESTEIIDARLMRNRDPNRHNRLLILLCVPLCPLWLKIPQVAVKPYFCGWGLLAGGMMPFILRYSTI
jgi:hypothetical protein